MDGYAQEVIHHLVSRGLNHLGCSRISILASVFFFLQCDRHQIQCLWAQSWMAAQLGSHIYMPGIKYDAFGRSHGWLRNMGCHKACFAEFVPVCIARPRVHSSERQDRSAAFFPALGARVQVKPLCWRRPLSTKLPRLLPRSCHVGSPGAARAVREGVESLSYSVPLGTSPWSGKVLLGTPRGPGARHWPLTTV